MTQNPTNPTQPPIAHSPPTTTPTPNPTLTHQPPSITTKALILSLLIITTQARYRPASQAQPDKKSQQDSSNAGGAQLSGIEVLGFEAWEEPSQEEIKAQYAKILEEYKANRNRDAAAEEKFRRVKDAYEELRRNGFNTGHQSERDNVNSGYNRRNRYNVYQQQTDIPKGRSGRQKQGFYSHSRTYSTDHQRQFDDLFDLLNDVSFMTFTADQDPQPQPHHQTFTYPDPHNSSQQPLKLHFNVVGFLRWLINNPTVILAAILISVGVINFCSCCFCCCCSKCCRKQGENVKADAKTQTSGIRGVGSYEEITNRKIF